MDRLLQLMHADGCFRNQRYEWAHYFEPSAELLKPFNDIENQELTWEDFEQ